MHDDAMHDESERAVRERIEATRSRIGDTIEEIGDRVNPDRVQRELKARARREIEDVKDNVKQKARSTMRGIEHEVNDAGRGIWNTIRHNPIPAGMVGVGLAWLLANRSGGGDDEHGRRYGGYRAYPEDTGVHSVGATGYTGYTGGRPVRSLRTEAGSRPTPDLAAGRHATGGGPDADEDGVMDEARERAGEAADRVRDMAGDAADEVRDRASDAAHEVRDWASGAAHDVRDWTSDAAHDVRDWTSDAAHEVGHQARRAERRVEEMVQENPLAAGVVAAALGFTAGLMIPETRREHEMMGPARDRMMHRAERKLREVGERAKDVARETAAETGRRAVDEVMGDGGSDQEQSRSGQSRVSEPGR